MIEAVQFLDVNDDCSTTLAYDCCTSVDVLINPDNITYMTSVRVLDVYCVGDNQYYRMTKISFVGSDDIIVAHSFEDFNIMLRR